MDRGDRRAIVDGVMKSQTQHVQIKKCFILYDKLQLISEKQLKMKRHVLYGPESSI